MRQLGHGLLVMTQKSQSLLSLSFIFLFSIAWGALTLGPRPLDIFDTSWLWYDLAQVYMAWSQYTSDPAASWLVSARLSYPLSMNFALFDPFPILLLALGKFSNLVPDKTQYFGVYFICSLCLQGLFGYLLLKQNILFSLKDRAYREPVCAMGALFFVLCPFGFYRFQQHFVLSSQWIIVMSIWASLGTRDKSLRTWLICNCLVILFVSGAHPYLTLMVLISQFSILIFFSNDEGALDKGIRMAALSSVCAIGLYVFGFLSAAGVRVFGYGYFSMNALAPFDSNGLGRLLPIDIPDPTGGQSWEGFNYLGVGTLLLCVSLLKVWRTYLKSADVPVRAGLVIVGFSYLLALSATITLGSLVIKLPVPGRFIDILSIFRATGRLFWVGGYWLIFLSIVLLIRWVGLKRGCFFLVPLLLLQLIDVYGVSAYVRHQISTTNRYGLDFEKMPIDFSDIDSILVVPPWQCGVEKTPGGSRNFEFLGVFAADKKIVTNSSYAARTPPEQLTALCDAEKILNSLSRDTLYILSSEVFEQNDVSDLSCAYNKDHRFYACRVQAKP